MKKKIPITLNFQNVSHDTHVPEMRLFQDWVRSVLKDRYLEAEITLRVVDAIEMTQLNFQYRGKNHPTNVLSFSLETQPLVGDIVLCAPVVKQEAQIQKKADLAHWAHLTVHGVLHLLGYDHVNPNEAKCMEDLEIKILKDLGISNPYEA